MRAYKSTINHSRLLLAVLLGGLGLLLTTADPGRSDDKPAQEPPKPDKPKEQLYQADFFGTKVTGQRFCIIADCSDSMHGTQLVQLKKEILKTLGGLDPASQFYIIFFNATDIPMPFPSWLDGTKENVEKVKPW